MRSLKVAIKKRDKKEVAQEAEKLANEIADKPYGKAVVSSDEEMTSTSFALPKSVLYRLEDIAKDNKRAGVEPKSVSALIREAITEKYL